MCFAAARMAGWSLTALMERSRSVRYRDGQRVWSWTFLIGCLVIGPVSAQPGNTPGEWRSYAADVQGTKYAALDQITADNFESLTLAWRWHSADAQLPYEQGSGVSLLPAQTVFDQLESERPSRWVTRPGIGRLSATPLMVDAVLYLVTPLYQAVAIDALTGETLWVHNPRV